MLLDKAQPVLQGTCNSLPEEAASFPPPGGREEPFILGLLTLTSVHPPDPGCRHPGSSSAAGGNSAPAAPSPWRHGQPTPAADPIQPPSAALLPAASNRVGENMLRHNVADRSENCFTPG